MTDPKPTTAPPATPAEVVLAELERQAPENFSYVDATNGLDEVVIDGTFDLVAVAAAVRAAALREAADIAERLRITGSRPGETFRATPDEVAQHLRRVAAGEEQ